MKKRRLNKTRILAALMSLCMIISLFNGIDLPHFFQNETIAQAEDGGVTGSSEYADETLEHMWGNGPDDASNAQSYWNSARSYYACTFTTSNDSSVTNTNTHNGTFASFGGVTKRTIFHVYAFEGETICLGSSVYNSGIDENNKLKSILTQVSGSSGFNNSNHYADEGSCDIVMTDLKGNKIPIDIHNSEGDTTGYIASPEAEFAAVKMTMNPDGTFKAPYTDSTGAKKNYTPYTYKVKETGLYTFEFHSYDGTGATNPNGGKTIGSQWPTSENQVLNTINTPSAAYGNFSDYKTDIKNNVDGSTTTTTTQTRTKTIKTEYVCNNYVEKRTYTIVTNTVGTAETKNPDGTTTTESINTEVESESLTYTDSGGIIAALNLTVFDENGEKQTGRTYADFLSLQMSTVSSSNKNVTESYYILTTDSYIYKMKFNDAAPYTYNFFSNNRGIFDNATGEIVYKSVKDVSNTNSFQKMGTFFVYPGNKDTEKDKSFYIFLEYPDDDLEGEIYQKAVQPDPATNIRFVGRVEINEYGEVKEVPGAYTGVGGYFAFDVKEATTATLRLEFKGDLEEENLVPVEISGVVKPNSTNYFYWDGKDGNGDPVPAGNYSLDDIVYTVTAKAGEIHFPIFDMEYASGGITFTRLSHIYDKSGKQLDTPGSIYDLTKNVIYYDETAIYYGENVAATGISESKVTGNPDVATTWAIDKFFAQEKNKGDFWPYRNLKDTKYSNGIYKDQICGGEYLARQSAYIQEHTTIRVGDHSHTTNIIDYFDTLGNVLGTPDATSDISVEQKEMIEYLDSSKYPVGKSDGTSKEVAVNGPDYTKPVRGNMSTTDFAIANYWTFIPAKPATTTKSDELLYIVDPPEEELFKLTGRVFYDVGAGGTQGNGKYDDTGENGEHLMSGVTLNLYKKTSDDSAKEGKKYFNYSGGKMTEVTNPTADSYELVDTGVTRTDGSYVFTNLEYDKDDGTEYLYEVVCPDSSYTLTSGSTKAGILVSSSTQYGYYASHSFNTDYTGTEIQKIKVGGSGVNPTKLNTTGTPDNPTSSVCAVDVGYYYATMQKSLWLKKTWNPETSPTTPNPASVIYELSYYSGTTGYVYDYRTLSGGGSWTDKNLFLPTETNGKTVADYYVSAEYFIDGGYIYKYSFKFNTSTGKYSSFVADASRIELATLFKGSTVPDNCTVNDLPDRNGDGVSDSKDLGSITGWESFNENEAADSYRAVLDRNILADKTEITVTNAQNPGTIEIYKYHDEDDDAEENALQGATFRLYRGTMEETMTNISDNNNTWISANYIGSATSRSNGRLTFTGLDPTQIYTVREVFAPDGFRILQEYYEVRPSGSEIAAGTEYVYEFDGNAYASFEIGNAPADTSLKIRKRIVGRAWQGGTTGVTDDSFTFKIVTSAPTNVAGLNSEDSEMKISSEEQEIQNKQSTDILATLSNFAANFYDSAEHSNVTISYDDDYYNYTVDGKKYASADTKMSGDLLTGSTTDSTSEPKFQGVTFPMAGEYTFTITEEPPTSGDVLNLEHSAYTYRVTVSVVRKYNDPEDEKTEPDMTTTNTHLEAEVSNITYRENDTAAFKTFSGSSPLFTNTYKTAPAEQKTSYKITKSFTGREGDVWLKDDAVLGSDEFTVEIKCADEDTIDAVKNGNLVISGFDIGKLANLTKLTDDTGWEYTFTEANENLEFKSFKFKDIEFPVQYVNSDGEVWTPKDPEQTIPTEDEIKGFTPETLPVTYKFTIKEKLPEGAEDKPINGITYDKSVYTLTIVLNNTEQGTTGSEAGKEEEDGIIEEIDITLSKGEEKSECKTRQGVLDRETWLSHNVTGNTYWYVDNAGYLQERSKEDPDSTPTNAKLYFWKSEQHDTTSADAFGGDGHTMTIKNTYAASYVWNPQVQKVLDGRTWRTDDKFTFTLTPDEHNPEGCSLNSTSAVATTIDSTNKDADDKYINSFDPITFTQPGTYKFSITETDINGTELATYPITIVLEDNKDGTLTATIDDESIADYVIKFVNEYEGTSFDLSISKTIIGREWKDGEEFTFKIEPDEKTLEAINNGDITLPTDTITPDTSGKYYTATISGGTGTDTLKKSLGNIKINNTKSLKPGEELNYKFTISEVTGDLENMYCRVPSYDLYIKVTPATSPRSNGSENTLSAEYACVVAGATEPDDTSYTTTEGGVTIAFENVATGTLTVEKEVVSSNEDTTEFSFTVEFTFDKDSTNEFTFAEIGKITADLGGESITPTVSSEGYTYTYKFKLKHGEKITFSNILPNTTYTITEGTEPTDYMFLRITDKDGNNVYDEDVGQKVSDKTISIDEPFDKYTFISGKIHNLPSAGGTGTQLILLGGLALIIAAALFYTLFYKNDKRRAAR